MKIVKKPKKYMKSTFCIDTKSGKLDGGQYLSSVSWAAKFCQSAIFNAKNES